MNEPKRACAISINYALALLAGHLIFGEALTAAKVLGVAPIIAKGGGRSSGVKP
jgi:threonine/homoserine efflux transporter RhtA